jgi:hypothetical protein
VLGTLEGVLSSLQRQRVVEKGKAESSNAVGRRSGRDSRTMEDTNIEANGSTRNAVNNSDQSQSALDTQTEEGIEFVHGLLTRAQVELSISELMRGVDDATIAGIPDAAASAVALNDSEHAPPTHNQDLHDCERNEASSFAAETRLKSTYLPSQIEEVLQKWESIVLTSRGP